MRLIETISKIRQDFKNDKLITIKEYKELYYFISKSKSDRFNRSMVTYDSETCKYSAYNLIANKISNEKISIIFKNLDNDIEKNYVTKI